MEQLPIDWPNTFLREEAMNIRDINTKSHLICIRFKSTAMKHVHVFNLNHPVLATRSSSESFNSRIQIGNFK